MYTYDGSHHSCTTPSESNSRTTLSGDSPRKIAGLDLVLPEIIMVAPRATLSTLSCSSTHRVFVEKSDVWSLMLRAQRLAGVLTRGATARSPLGKHVARSLLILPGAPPPATISSMRRSCGCPDIPFGALCAPGWGAIGPPHVFHTVNIAQRASSCLHL